MYNILTAAGYNVDFIGTQNGNSVAGLPDPDHEGHPGWRIDQLDSNIAGWFGSIVDPDVILLHIGTNDFGQNYDINNAANRLDGLITKMANLRPYAHIIVTNLMVRTDNATANNNIQSLFNPQVPTIVANHAALGQRVTFLDMRSAVPSTDFADGLHPNQTGYNEMADAWLPAIQAVIGVNGDTAAPAVVRARGAIDQGHVAVTFSKPVADSAATVGNFSADGGLTVSSAVLDSAKRVVTLTTSPQTIGATYNITVNGVSDRETPTPLSIPANSIISFNTALPLGYLNNVPESVGYTLVYSLDIPTAADYHANVVPYTVDNHLAIGPFTRVAYYLELQSSSGDLQYAWASMDAFTSNPALLGVPTLNSGAVFQQGVTNLNVVSNAAGVTTGTGMTGNIEFWPTNYGPENTPAPGVPGASDTLYDFGDHPTPGGYGSMQIHNTGAAQTVMAFNNWGGNTNTGNLDLGIGNDPAPVNGGVDWTFANNAGNYVVKTLQVLVQTSGDTTPPSLVSAVANFGMTSIRVSFSEPLAAASISAVNFQLNNGVSVLSASLAPNQRDVVLTTTTQPAGVPLTLSVNGVRDSSPSANMIPPGSTIAVSAPALPTEVTNNIGAASNGYQLVYSINLPVTGNFNSAGAANFTVDDHAAIGAFKRVAYYLELQKPGGPVQYVWAAMDAFTMNRAKLALPTLASGAIFQQNVTNLDVVSNVSGIVTGTSLSSGNIEFWPNDYTAANGANVPNASASNYDTGDTRTTSGGNNYGSMQIHNHDAAANQTILAVNHFGNDGNVLDIGIGNDTAPVSGGVDWTFAANANTYSRRVLHVMVLPGTNPPPAAVAANVPEATGYQLVYAMNIPTTGNFNNTTGVYTLDNHTDVGAFSRVAYYLEVQKTGDPAPTYIWTSMDAFTSDAGKIGIPTADSGAIFQQNVTNLNVVSNSPGIVTGTGLTGGNLEFWPGSYTQANGNNVPNASGSTYDFGDTRTPGTGYGSMQVHNHDPSAKQTLFALNDWGVNGKTLDLGIGNDPAPVNGGVDWTFAANAATYDLERTLYVFVLPGNGDHTGPVAVSATGSSALNRLVVTFNEALADTAANPANFSIPGLTVTGATLLPSGRDVALYTSAQTAGTLYTVNITGVQDRSPAGNLSLPGASITFTAATPPAVLGNIPEASGYNLVYQLAIPTSASFNSTGVAYTVDESKYPQTQPFDRLAYCLELQTASASTWVYVSCDAFTTAIGKIGVPIAGTGASFQQNLTNMNVFASAGTTVVTGTGLTGGNIEFWPTDYSATNSASVPNASATNFDFGDQPKTTGNYGSMQIHNHDASQTIFAFNNWGGNGNPCDLGIGNDPSPTNLGVDWTFANNAGTYTVKNLYVLARAGGTPLGTPPLILSQPISRSVNAGGGTTFAVGVNGSGPFLYQWRFNGSPIAGATNPWLDLSGITAGQQGTYDVVVTGAGAATSTSAPATLTVIGGNHSPTFGGYAFTTSRNTPVIVSQGALLAKATDADGDTLTVGLTVGLTGGVSQQGGSISLGGSGVAYSPAANFTGVDSFAVTISDGKGGSVSGTVTVNVTSANISSAAQSGIAIRGDGKVDLLFYGAPGKAFTIERSTDLQNWTTLQALAPGDDGLLPFTDPAPPAGKAFYRSKTTIP